MVINNRRAGWGAISRKIGKIENKTKEAHVENIEKRTKNKDLRAQYFKENKEIEHIEPESESKPINSTDLWQVFSDLHTEEIGRVNYKYYGWSVKDKTLAVKMLEMFGFDQLKSMTEYMFEHWDRIWSKSDVSTPTVVSLWYLKDQISIKLLGKREGHLTRRQKALKYGEYNAEKASKTPNVVFF